MLNEYNYHTRVMGCDFDMTFIAESVEKADGYFTEAIKIASFYEDKFSRFNDVSELSYVNKNKSAEISPEFLNIFKIAFELYKKTDGKFNPLLQVSRIGYDQSFEKIIENLNEKNKEIEERENLQYNSKLENITISENCLTLQKDQELDFGGFLKGYVAQEITQKIKSANGMIINIGGDIYVSGKDCEQKKFEIEIVNPHDENKNIKISVENKAICTSGIYKRKWKNNNENKHHIINSQSKDSAETDIISASVINESGAIADSYATLAITLGSKKAQDFLKKENIEFIIICKNGAIIKSANFKF